MGAAEKILAEAMQLTAEEREELAAKLLDSIEPEPASISIDDVDEIERRAAEARSGTPGIPWNEVKRGLVR